MRTRWLWLLAMTIALGACGDESAATGAVGSSTTTTTLAGTTANADPSTTTTSTTSPSTTSTTPPAPAPVAPVAFAAVINEVDEQELGASWRAGCPVAPEDLRRIDMPHHDDGGEIVAGSLVVHRDHVDDVVAVFERLFDAAFPIHSMQPVHVFDADDDASMAANNTSAFNCREIAGRPGVWSQHSFGGAIDINPLVNPWVRGDQVDPPGGVDYVDRTVDAAGVVRDGDVVTQAFADIGWGWGGDWSTSKDYQHFSHNGR